MSFILQKEPSRAPWAGSKSKNTRPATFGKNIEDMRMIRIDINKIWIDINKLKPFAMRTVLLAYTDGLGKRNITIGWYAPARTIESAFFEGDVDDEYDETSDTYYLKEQLVDQSVESDFHYPVSGVTHWMLLPELPEDCELISNAKEK